MNSKDSMQNRYVQYGCGFSAPDGWRNYDASPTLRFERLPMMGKVYTRNRTRFPDAVMYGDIVTGLPEEPASCDGVYCSHILEHLTLADCRTALRNTFDLLKPGGIFRLVVPDMEQYARWYLDDPSVDAVHNFMKISYLGQKTRRRSIKDFLVDWLGNSKHLWMWDYKAMEKELADAGFGDIRRAAFNDSSDPAFTAVEDEGRWSGSLGVECRKLSI